MLPMTLIAQSKLLSQIKTKGLYNKSKHQSRKKATKVVNNGWLLSDPEAKQNSLIDILSIKCYINHGKCLNVV